jgi:hypothetical protein
MSSQPSERAAVVGVIVPLLRDDVTDAVSDAVDMSKFGSLMAVLVVGATDTTVDLALTESATSGGSYTAISGKSITQQTGTDDNEVCVINLKAEELSSGMRYVKANLDVGNGTSGADTCVILLGLDPKHGPASDDDLSAVAQIIT